MGSEFCFSFILAESFVKLDHVGYILSRFNLLSSLIRYKCHKLVFQCSKIISESRFVDSVFFCVIPPRYLFHRDRVVVLVVILSRTWVGVLFAWETIGIRTTPSGSSLTCFFSHIHIWIIMVRTYDYFWVGSIFIHIVVVNLIWILLGNLFDFWSFLFAILRRNSPRMYFDFGSNSLWHSVFLLCHVVLLYLLRLDAEISLELISLLMMMHIDLLKP